MIYFMTSFSKCDPAIARAITLFWKEFGDPSSSPYRSYSKGFPILGLVKKHLDQPLINFFQIYAPILASAQMSPFTLSAMLKNGGDLYPLLKNAIRNLHALERLGDCATSKSTILVASTLESLIEVDSECRACLAQLPKKITTEYPSRITTNQKTKGDPFNHGFCELCWRGSEAAEHRKNDEPHQVFESPVLGQVLIPAKRVSRRYCREHKPKVNHSEYRKALKHKVRFHDELARLQKYYREDDALEKRRKAAWDFFMGLEGDLAKYLKSTENNPSIRMPTEMEVRKEAYDNVQRQLSKTSEIIRLHGEGMKRVEIARQLDVTRQAVSNAIRREQKKAVSHAKPLFQ